MKKLKFLTTLFLLLSISIFSIGQTKKVMSVIDFLNIPAVSNPRLAPVGNEMIYLFAESDWKANRQVNHLWRVNLDGTDARQITFGTASESNPAWSPDGKHISFLAKRASDKVTQLYVMRSDGGEGQAITNHKTAVRSYQWSADGAHIFFLASDPLTAEEETAKKMQDDVYMLDENYKQVHLWKINVDTKEETQITEGDYTIAGYHLAADGKKLVVHRAPNPLYDFYSESEIWVMNSDGSDALQLTDNDIGESSAQLSPDGKNVLFVAFANEAFDFYYNDKIFVLPTDGSGKVAVPMKDESFEVSTARWSKDGNSIYFLANTGARSQLFQYELNSEKLTALTKGNHAIGQWHYNTAQDQHLMSVNTMQNPGDIFWLKNGTPQQITHHYDYLAKTFHLPTQELVSWKREDGVTVEGLLYKPHDYQDGKKYPLVVQTHGGPASSDKFGLSRSFTRYNPVLTAKGYVVLQPNYRGSTGYGDAFLRDMVGGYFRQSHLVTIKK